MMENKGFGDPINAKGTMFLHGPLTFQILALGLFCLSDHFKGKIEYNLPVQSDGSFVWAEPFDSAPFDVDEFSIDLVSFLVQGGGQINVGHGAEQFVPGTR